MIGLVNLCEELCFRFPTFYFLFFLRLRYLCRWFGVFDSFCGFSMLWILGVFFVIDDFTLRFDLNRIEYSLRLIRDYALTGNSDSMEIMILNFAWIVRFSGNCCKKWCSVSGKPLRSSESRLGRGSYNYWLLSNCEKPCLEL